MKFISLDMLALILAFVLLTAGQSPAQQVNQDDPSKVELGVGEYFRLLENQPFRTELNLTKKQQNQLEQGIAKFKELRTKFHYAWGRTESKIEPTVQIENFNNRSKEFVEPLFQSLSTNQKTRFEQLLLQHKLRLSENCQHFLMTTPPMSKELDLSPSQLDEIRAIAIDRDEEIQQEVDKYLKKVRAIQEQTNEDSMVVLTAEQKDNFEKKVGGTVTFFPSMPMSLFAQPTTKKK